MNIEVFGEVDKTKEGQITSEYPSWYNKRHEDELEEGINHKRRMLEQGLVPPSEIGITRETLRKEEERLDLVRESKPKAEGVVLDNLSKVRKELGSAIKGAMFTYTDMQKGLADAHEEARRMSEPVIELKGTTLEFVKRCNVSVEGNKVTRTGAEKAWKIASKLLGEVSNTESLRPPK